MASPLKEILNKLSFKITPILEHLIYIYFQRGARERNHWAKEIAGFVEDIPKVKGRNKYPTKEEILNGWWKITHRDSFDDKYIHLIKQAETEESGFDWSEAKADGARERVKKFIDSFFDKASEILSDKGVLFRNEVVEIIDLLL